MNNLRPSLVVQAADLLKSKDLTERFHDNPAAACKSLMDAAPHLQCSSGGMKQEIPRLARTFHDFRDEEVAKADEARQAKKLDDGSMYTYCPSPSSSLTQHPSNFPASAVERSEMFGLALLGFPVAHSASPIMHNAALRAAQLSYSYLPIEVKPEELAPTLQRLTQLGFLGLNITIPHKQAILPHLDVMSEHATFLGAVNTVLIRDGKLRGYNTDGPGFVAAIKETWNSPLADQRILILGATGGAGRAIAAQCVLEQCRMLYLASRYPDTLEPLLESLSQRAPASCVLKALSLDQDTLASIMPHVDLIVNATPVGMSCTDDSLITSELFHPHQFLYDTIYSPRETPLMKAASKAGARVANGYSMLLHQGALAFQHWFEQPAPLEVMRDALSTLGYAAPLDGSP